MVYATVEKYSCTVLIDKSFTFCDIKWYSWESYELDIFEIWRVCTRWSFSCYKLSSSNTWPQNCIWVQQEKGTSVLHVSQINTWNISNICRYVISKYYGIQKYFFKYTHLIRRIWMKWFPKIVKHINTKIYNISMFWKRITNDAFITLMSDI